MDDQSPGCAIKLETVESTPSVLEVPNGDPPTGDSPRPIQELSDYCQGLDQHRRETVKALCLVESVCKESKEKDKAIGWAFVSIFIYMGVKTFSLKQVEVHIGMVHCVCETTAGKTGSCTAALGV